MKRFRSYSLVKVANNENISFKDNCKAAFTLAEVMIVVVIIGIVAVFTIPILLSEVTERIYSNRQANIAQKVTKAVELMIVNGDYERFETTEEFVDKLRKYIKVIRVCDADNLTKCWPSKTITTSNGSKYNVEDAKTGKQLHTISSTNNVGLILNDGASILLTYNPNAVIPNSDVGFSQSKKSLPIGGGKTKEFAYTSNATNAIDFVMDVNGTQGPNAETDENGNYYDIRSFKAASFSTAGCQGFKIGTVCVVDLGTNYSPINCNNESFAKYCGRNSGYSLDYWAGAQKACDDIGMELPNRDNAKSLFTGAEDKFSGYYWTSSEYSVIYVYHLNCNNLNDYAVTNKSNQIKAFCVSN